MIEYRLRVSRWARGLTLRVTAEGHLEVIAPRRPSPRRLAQVLAQERAWIDAATREAAARRAARPPPPPWQLPSTITLPVVGAAWTVIARPTARRGVRVAPDGLAAILDVSGQIADQAACRRALLRWLTREAHTHLLSRLACSSRTCGLPYTRGAIRQARRRWGTCSRAGGITLNARLLLLPAPVVEYVLVHELCHTREPNHGPRFWTLVGQHCPTYHERRRELRAAGEQLPAWVLTPGERVPT
jgi:predicted metal-dependent hydrolase